METAGNLWVYPPFQFIPFAGGFLLLHTMGKKDTTYVESTVDEIVSQWRGREDRYDFKNCATNTDHGKPYFKDDVVVALMVSGCNVAKASRLLGRRRNNLAGYINNNDDVHDFVREEREGQFDQIEQNTIESAIAGDGADRRFILTTRAKDRGYTTRVEKTGADGGPIETEVIGAKKILEHLLAKKTSPDGT